MEIDVVGTTEGDDLLHSLGHGKVVSPEARRFWMELVGSKEASMSVQEMEGYKERLDESSLWSCCVCCRKGTCALSPDVQAEIRRRLRQNGD